MSNYNGAVIKKIEFGEHGQITSIEFYESNTQSIIDFLYDYQRTGFNKKPKTEMTTEGLKLIDAVRFDLS